jgi:hypothetical protein
LIYPQSANAAVLNPQAQSSLIAKETCTLAPSRSELCDAITTDFLVRNFPQEFLR